MAGLNAPTFFSMFNPANSPFYAPAVAATTCLALTVGNDARHSAFAVGWALIVLTIAFAAAPFMRVRVEPAEFNYTLIHARSVGLVGSLSTLGVLATGKPFPDASTDGVVTNHIFMLAWGAAVVTIILMLATFFLTARSKPIFKPDAQHERARFNIVQHMTIHSSMLMCLAYVGKDTLQIAWDKGNVASAYSSGLINAPGALVEAVFALGWRHPEGPSPVVALLLLLLTASFMVGVISVGIETRPELKRPVREPD